MGLTPKQTNLGTLEVTGEDVMTEDEYSMAGDKAISRIRDASMIFLIFSRIYERNGCVNPRSAWQEMDDMTDDEIDLVILDYKLRKIS